VEDERARASRGQALDATSPAAAERHERQAEMHDRAARLHRRAAAMQMAHGAAHDQALRASIIL
jgi:hypothetical protein